MPPKTTVLKEHSISNKMEKSTAATQFLSRPTQPLSSSNVSLRRLRYQSFRLRPSPSTHGVMKRQRLKSTSIAFSSEELSLRRWLMSNSKSTSAMSKLLTKKAPFTRWTFTSCQRKSNLKIVHGASVETASQSPWKSGLRLHGPIWLAPQPTRRSDCQLRKRIRKRRANRHTSLILEARRSQGGRRTR